jgi:predicted PurR-regulated permease PerM/phosphoglycolate phosphatase-like HAD superfamily hydrolase
MTSKRWGSTTKIIVTAALVFLAIVLLITFRAMIRPTIIALLLTFLLYQPVNWVQQRTAWSRGVSIVAIYLLLILLLLAAPVIFIPRLVESFESLVIVLDTLVVDLQTATSAPILSVGEYELSVNILFQQLGEILQNILSPAAAGALGFALTLTTTILTTVYVLVLGFWLLKDIHKLQRLVLQSLPADYREDARRLGQELGAIWTAFLRGQFALGLVIGVVTWIAMTIVGLPNAAGLALLAGIMEFLPTVGPGISGAVGTLVALFQGSTWLPVNNFIFALIVLGLYVIITQVESVYLIPRLVGRRVHLHPAVTFTGIISAAVTVGVLGVLLITPTIASVRVILIYVLRKLRDEEPFQPPHVQTEIRIPGLIAGHRIDAVIFDLDGTLTELDWRFADEMAHRSAQMDRFWNFDQRRRFFQQIMAFLDGWINRWIGLLSWLQLHDDVRRMMPLLNRLRGFPPASALTLQSGVHELLANLAYSYKLGLLTSRPGEDVKLFLQNNHLPASLFVSISTQEDQRRLGADAEAIRRSLDIMQINADQLLVVSDSEMKLRTAEAVGCVTCGLLYGMSSSRHFADADLILAYASELDGWL